MKERNKLTLLPST